MNLDIDVPHVDPTNMTISVINAALGIAGVVAVAFIIYAGVTFTTSAGDPTKVGRARKMLLYSIVGLIIVLLAFAIVNFVLNDMLK